MIIAFGRAGNERKKLAWAIATIIGTTAEYQYMPPVPTKSVNATPLPSPVIWKLAIKPTVRKQNGFLLNWQVGAMLFRTPQNRNPRA